MPEYDETAGLFESVADCDQIIAQYERMICNAMSIMRMQPDAPPIDIEEIRVSSHGAKRLRQRFLNLIERTIQ